MELGVKTILPKLCGFLHFLEQTFSFYTYLPELCGFYTFLNIVIFRRNIPSEFQQFWRGEIKKCKKIKFRSKSVKRKQSLDQKV